MTPKQFVKQRLGAMFARPEMWAASNEAFGLQLCLLVEVYQLDVEPSSKIPTDKLMAGLFGPGPVVKTEPLNVEWAQSAALAVRKILASPLVGQFSHDL